MLFYIPVCIHSMTVLIAVHIGPQKLFVRMFNQSYFIISFWTFISKIVLDRSSGFSIYAYYDATYDSSSPKSSNLVYHNDPLSGCPAPVQNFTVNRLAKQIVFTNTRPDGFQTNCPGKNGNLYTSIEICEIKVMGKIILKYIILSC